MFFVCCFALYFVLLLLFVPPRFFCACFCIRSPCNSSSPPSPVPSPQSTAEEEEEEEGEEEGHKQANKAQ